MIKLFIVKILENINFILLVIDSIEAFASPLGECTFRLAEFFKDLLTLFIHITRRDSGRIFRLSLALGVDTSNKVRCLTLSLLGVFQMLYHSDSVSPSRHEWSACRARRDGQDRDDQGSGPCSGYHGVRVQLL